MVRTLAEDPRTLYSEAQMIAVFLTVDHAWNPEQASLSDKFTDFRDIRCVFRYGDNQHVGPRWRRLTLFTMKNEWPLHWDQWSDPVPRPAHVDDPVPFQWEQASGRISAEWADVLLKAQGYTGRYARVILRRVYLGRKPLGWCFGGVETSGGELRDVLVEIATGQVYGLLFC
ncbi:MAG: hypothetical protein Q9211_005101 [Gyalolechia sp. 1 TL-2023]